ncbi:hypothetical protein KVT40_001761 [Elsinoe batatas]|uniref:Uncharacterized protein n=1 Tax=Elsinoe batatas TaxID=2601811 RepID=A0A8K0L6J8_9PEZI|nr:hypothetical protein KVT40_001761 [Elsinoe batatas]
MDPSEQAAALIKKLNDPSQARRANIISQQLQELQLSPDGWTIADRLLSTDDNVFQFYGALTFQIKVNRDVSTLDENDSRQILDRVMDRLVTCINNATPARVTDKLWSVLGSFLMHAPRIWQDPLGEALLRLMGLESNDTTVPLVHHVASLTMRQLRALLKLALILSEDLGSLDGDTPKNHEVEQALKRSSPVLSVLVLQGITREDSSGQLYGEALNVFSEWLLYGVNRWQRDVVVWSIYQHLGDAVVQSLYSGNFSLVFAAAESLSIAILNDPNAINKSQLNRMWPAIEHALQATEDSSIEERLPLLKLVGAWGKIMLEEILVQPNAPRFQPFFQIMTNQLFGIDWAEDGCDLLYIAMEFWAEFGDQLDLELGHNFTQIARLDLASVFDPMIQAFFDVLDRKDDRTMADVDPDNVENWQRVRQDFAEFLFKLSELDLMPIYDICADQLDQAVEQNIWFRVESVLQILIDMAYDWESTPETLQGLRRIFSSGLFKHMLDPAALGNIDLRMKRIVVRFIDSYSSFFQDEPKQIPDMLTLLMKMLEDNVGTASKVADLLAKCIASICSACREELTNMVQELSTFCGRTLATTGLTAYQRDKLYSAITFVVEALPREELKIEPLKGIIERLHADASFAKVVISSGQREAGEQLLVATFQCLAGVGKALHDRPRQVILDDDGDAANQSTSSLNPWSGKAGDAIVHLILEVLQCITLIPESGDAWEGACSVLRVGLSETIPGPFTFSPSLTSSFLSSMTPSTPRLEALLTTACAFVSSVSRSTTARVPDQVSAILGSVSTIILSLDSPASDPALAQLCVDFLERLLSRYSDVLFGSPNLASMVNFCLSALVSDTPMLKRTTAAFLAAIIALPQQLARNEIVPPVPGLVDYSQQVINDLLPHVASAIVHQLGGNAQRSELDAVSKVLRGFMMASPRAKPMLEEALNGSAFPEAAKATPQQKRVFASRVTMLRGGKGTTDAVKNFWAESKGTIGKF